jgi:NADPH:quinone reductase-like Zn-dependent oxidoreductase
LDCRIKRPRDTGDAMKAAVRDRYGPPEVVHIEEVPTPVPTGDQVLVRVRAAGANRADLDGLYPRWQFTRVFLGIRRPRQRRLGIDVAGVVDSAGPDVTRFKPGDRVFAELFIFGGEGTFAEFVCTRQEAFAPIPDGISDEVAAVLPHSGVLAMQSLRRSDGRTLKAGERLLVVGASGNVGPYVVQIAKARGAHVTAVARGQKLDFVRSLGADEVIDYQTADPTRPAQPYDWIVDVDAHHSLWRWRRALKPRGIYIALGGSSRWLLGLLVLAPALRLATSKRMGLMLGWKPFHRPDIEELLRLVAAGRLKPSIDRRFPLDQIVDALRWIEDGKARGKVLIVP